MNDLETTQSKLRSTPTAGVAGEHSAYYRRLLSAGYKGYVQGSIGGATLYGVMGLAVGALVGVPALLLSGGSLLPLILIPAIGGLGIVHGAGTFGDIGKTAAIIAESADTNEKRRYLLDRYYDATTNAEEKQVIKQQLDTLLTPAVPEHMFHMKTVLIGAALGGVIALGFMMLPAMAGALGIHAAAAAGGVFSESLFGFNLATIFGGLAPLAVTAIGTALGTVAGGMIGLDREYVRRWMDGAEVTVNDPARAESELAIREREVTQLGVAASHDTARSTAAKTSVIPEPAQETSPVAQLEHAASVEPISPRAIAPGTGQPATQISHAQSPERLGAIQHAMQAPVL